MKASDVKNTLSDKTQNFYNSACERLKDLPRLQFTDNYCNAYFEQYSHEPLRKRQALSFAYALLKEPVNVRSKDYLTGQIYLEFPSEYCCRWEEFNDNERTLEIMQTELPELCKPEFVAEDTWIADLYVGRGHIGWHWEWIVNNGTNALLDKIEKSFQTQDAKGKEFLEGMKICIEAVNAWADLHVDELNKLLSQTNVETEKMKLEKQIEICSRVPRFGATNFREAVQAFHFSYSIGMLENPYGGNGPGRLDYHLWPYLEKDLATGIETESSAREIIDELFIRIHERLHFVRDGHVEAIVIAGTSPDGNSSYNPLSKIMVESITALEMTHPSLYIRMPDNPEEELLELAANYLRNGSNRCQILNDKSIINALTEKGVTYEDAIMYMCGGCMEVSSQGTNGDMLFTNFFNTPKMLELFVNGGTCLVTGKKMLPELHTDLSSFSSFDEFYSSFMSELERVMHLWFKRIDICVKQRAKLKPSFYISAQIDDCIQKGRGINDGGARYEDYGATPLAIPNMGDCLYAIKQAVFEEKFISAKELLKALQNNFAGNEVLRLRLQKLPKFGQGNKEADNMVSNVLNDVCEIFGSYTNVLGGKVRPMIMTFTLAARAGKALGASPDGRPSGLPIAHGLTPQSTSMTYGLSTAMNSANSICLKEVWGGATSMWDIDKKFATTDNLKAIIKTFLDQGGQIYQGNTTDVIELLEAQKAPEKYPHLIVRVGGYSGRFVTLHEDLQNDVINRYRHGA